MIITKDWPFTHEACKDGREWVLKNHPDLEAVELIKKLAEHRFDWANWVLVRLLTDDQKFQYAIYAAEHVLDVFEKRYPNDNRPRKAIEAAKNYVENKSDATANANTAAGRVAGQGAVGNCHVLPISK